MQTILKYPLDWQGPPAQTVSMPRGAQVLHGGKQGEVVVLWALADRNAPMEDRHFHIYATGDEVKHGHDAYLGTVQTGAFVWHIFEGQPA